MAKEQFSKKDLEAVATDLNKIFEQPIPTGRKATVATLKKDLLEAAKEIQAEDDISDESKEILASLGAKLPFEEEEVMEEKPKDEVEKEKPKKEAEKKYNRAQAFCDALSGKAKTITEIAQKAMDLHSEAHPNKKQPQLSSIEWAVKDYLQPLIILDFVEKKDGKYSLR